MNREIKLEIGKLVWSLFFVLSVLFLFLSFPMWAKVITGLFIALSVIFFLKGFRIIPEEQRWVIELLGKYSKTVGPGLVWLFPFIEKPRAYVSLWSQIYPLFSKSTWVEFADGKAKPVNARALVRCIPDDKDAPRRMVYETRDVKMETVSLLESILRTYFATLSIEEAFKVKYDVWDSLKEWERKEEKDKNKKEKEREREKKKEGRNKGKDREEVEKQLKELGLMVENITIEDFEPDPDMEKARKRIQKEKEEKDAAEVRIKRNALEIGGLIIKTLAELLEKKEKEERENKVKDLISSNPELQAQMIELTKELLIARLASEAGNFIKVNIPGKKGGLEEIITNAIAVFTRLTQSQSSQSQEGKTGKE